MLSSHSSKKRKRKSSTSQRANTHTVIKKAELDNPLINLRNIAFELQKTIRQQEGNINTLFKNKKALNKMVEQLTELLSYLRTLTEQSSFYAITIFKKALRIKILIQEALVFINDNSKVKLNYPIYHCRLINLGDLIKKIDLLFTETHTLSSQSLIEELPPEVLVHCVHFLEDKDFYSTRLTSQRFFHIANDANPYQPLPPDLAICLQNENSTINMGNLSYVLKDFFTEKSLNIYNNYRKLLVELAFAFSKKFPLTNEEIEERMQKIFNIKTHNFFASQLEYIASLAAELGHVSILQYLYKIFPHNMNGIYIKENSLSPLIYAAKANQTAAVKFIIKVNPKAMEYIDRRSKHPILHCSTTEGLTESFHLIYNASSPELKQAYFYSTIQRIGPASLEHVLFFLKNNILLTPSCWGSISQQTLVKALQNGSDNTNKPTKKAKSRNQKAIQKSSPKEIYKLLLNFYSNDKSYMAEFEAVKLAFFGSDYFFESESFETQLALLKELTKPGDFALILHHIAVKLIARDSHSAKHRARLLVTLQKLCEECLLTNQFQPFFINILRLTCKQNGDNMHFPFDAIKAYTSPSYLFLHVAKLLKDAVEQHYFLHEESIDILKDYLLEADCTILPIKFILLDLGITPPFYMESKYNTLFLKSLPDTQQSIVEEYITLFINEDRFPLSSLQLAANMYPINFLPILKNLIAKIDCYSSNQQLCLMQFILTQFSDIHAHSLPRERSPERAELTKWIDNISADIPDLIREKSIALLTKLCVENDSILSWLRHLQITYFESIAENIISSFSFRAIN